MHRLLFFEGTRPAVRTARARPAPAPAARAEQGPVAEAPTLSPDAREFFSRLLGIAGLDGRDYRERALVRRLPACLRVLRAPSIREATALIGSDPELARAALGTVLLGVTEFFRDPAVFAFLEADILPRLGSLPRPRIWSAACSDGRELYSVALLLGRGGLLPRCELLGTDCRAEAISRAWRGVFPRDDAARAAPPGRLVDTREGRRVPADVRDAIVWKQANVLAGAEPGPWHLILCRNLSIYLEPGAAARLWTSLVAELAPGGHLVVGKADYPPRHLPLQRLAGGVYRRLSP